MAITSTDNRAQYTSTGTTGPYPFPFPVVLGGITVIITDTDPLGADTILSPGDYSVTYVGNDPEQGGFVTLDVAPTAGYTVTVLRTTPQTQEDEFYNGQPTLYSTVEDALDQLTMEVQDLQAQLYRTPMLRETSTLGPQVLPDPDPLQYLQWNPIGTELQNGPLTITTTQTGVTTLKYLSNYASFAAALAVIGDSTYTTLIIDTAATVAVNTVVTSNIEMICTKMGGFSIATSVSLDINGPFAAGHQVFSGAGTVRFGLGSTSAIYLGWSATGDGTTNDLAAFLAAFQSGCLHGIPLLLAPGANYNLGVAADASQLLPYTHAKLHIIGNGATITATTNAISQGHVFYLTDPLYAIFDNVIFSNPGYVDSEDWEGVHHVYVESTAATSIYGNITFRDVTVNGGISPLTIHGGTNAGRLQNIRFEGNCVFNHTYYGLEFQQQGDNVSGSYTANLPRRAYYAYGVRGHDLNINIYHDGISASADGNAVISTRSDAGIIDSSTRNIKLVVNLSGVAPWGAVVKFQHNSDAQTGITDNVDVQINASGITYPTTDVVSFTAWNLAGSSLQATTNSVWDHIKLSGAFLRSNGVMASIDVNSTQNVLSHLIIDTVTEGGSIGLGNQPQLPGFNVTYPNNSDAGQVWAPIDGSGAGLTLTYQDCYYYRTGKFMYVTFNVTYPATADVTTAKIAGLTTAVSTAGGSSVYGGYLSYNNTTFNVTPRAAKGATYFILSGADGVSLTNAQMGGRQIMGMLIYKVL